jgi:DNA adenine methylase
MNDSLSPATPVLKWVGGKSRLLSEVKSFFPAEISRYHEPFAGGAAVFFSLSHPDSFLYDINKRLISFYRHLAGRPEELFDAVEIKQNQFNSLPQPARLAWYTQTREELNSRSELDLESAALFLAINKTCFNGIYRENSKGKFNVPFNQAKTSVNFARWDSFQAASNALRAAKVESGSFELVEKHAASGDLVYFDPPYVPISPTSNFTGYSATGFGEPDQLRLLSLSMRLRDKGVCVVSSNSYSPWVIEHYEKAGFAVRPVSVKRGIAAKTSARKSAMEAVITSE